MGQRVKSSAIKEQLYFFYLTPHVLRLISIWKGTKKKVEPKKQRKYTLPQLYSAT
jgi:hypothetical protein